MKTKWRWKSMRSDQTLTRSKESSTSSGLDECAATLLGLVVSLLVVAVVGWYTFSSVARSFQTWGRSACANLACSTSYLQRNKACYRESTGILFFFCCDAMLMWSGRLWCEDLVKAERKDALRHKVFIAAIVRHLFWPFPRYFQHCWRLPIL